MTLAEVDASAWAELEGAAADPQSAFRYLNLCSVDAGGRPQARMVVLRRVDVARRVLEIHTDVRSPKWQEISANPLVTILGFGPQPRVQLRLQGSAELHGPASELAAEAWSLLPGSTRSTYMGGPPGDDIGERPASEAEVADADGQAFFGVLIFRAETLDWFQLRHADNRRAVFAYDKLGALTSSRWVNP
ncbi:pyridoxamine 5'-phosphate oxidase [Rhizobium ruizarguesonis]|uniref:pyridoxamine 5'-phosphate oxidase family protein n=1 Tax=Rhizobium ruizarguesonis TaxID=2081791 RepID=UPI0010311A37|nr:pyridoxamine 5'-phosphate oxidase family protein [Rhizobium ruizarguesonis]QIJ39450.1 pyridoxamine 5'-phosphate oxidase [Rhizobium leguminosarum]NEH33084.1 pyridoxamine 5'-phosphate oxidase [Rhizobium ruizarguesonis]NEJ10834.1 pyridoxamine 5'-phosphate oxidase [Rhizobium ruizarguesonis]NEK12934.1 pyridoxamine 5'-phosphate oxidase [Rhizobium ruizarguesonis]TAU09051.1 pyridoxamine 5'-phosphate oxidase [Rhizobium ruizarguesonis]